MPPLNSSSGDGAKRYGRDATRSARSRFCPNELEGLMRRPSGQAAELILKALSEARPDPLCLVDLELFKGLRPSTLRENVRALVKQMRINKFTDGDRKGWFGLAE